jgi:hypothetical protein
MADETSAVAFIEGWLQRFGKRAKVRRGQPATAEEIREVEEAAGFPLPGGYVEFLQRFGALHVDAGTGVECVLLGWAPRSKGLHVLTVRQNVAAEAQRFGGTLEAVLPVATPTRDFEDGPLHAMTADGQCGVWNRVRMSAAYPSYRTLVEAQLRRVEEDLEAPAVAGSTLPELLASFMGRHGAAVDVLRGTPASDADIAALQAQTDSGLPEDYVEFLRTYGALHVRAREWELDVVLHGHAPGREYLDVIRQHERYLQKTRHPRTGVLLVGTADFIQFFLDLDSGKFIRSGSMGLSLVGQVGWALIRLSRVLSAPEAKHGFPLWRRKAQGSGETR